jgi:hypothetical protein
MRLAVFLHGTIIMHASGVGCTREERVAQVRRDPSVHAYADYVPIGEAVAKLQCWHEQGAQIVYLSSHRDPQDVAKDELVLRRYAFPPGAVLFRQGGDTYGAVAERARPDVLIEDDCESIGGLSQMTYPHLPPEARQRIAVIVVREFEGIDHLPDDVSQLQSNLRGA